MAKLSKILLRKAKSTCLFACFVVLYPGALVGDFLRLVCLRTLCWSVADSERVALIAATCCCFALVVVWLALVALAASRVEAPVNFVRIDVQLSLEFGLGSCLSAFLRAVCLAVGSMLVIAFIVCATLLQLWLMAPGPISFILAVGACCYSLA